eukprot:965816_1
MTDHCSRNIVFGTNPYRDVNYEPPTSEHQTHRLRPFVPMSIKHMTSMMPRALHNTGSIRPNAISSHPKRQCRSHAFTDNVDPTHSPVDDSDYRRNVHHDDPTHYSPPMPDLTPSLIVADYLNHRIQMMCHTMTSSAHNDTMMCHTATSIAPGQTPSPSHLQFLASTIKTCNFLHRYRTQNAIHRLMLPSDQYSRFIG